MEYNIRPAKKEDLQQILELIKELAAFEKEPDAVEVDLNTLEEEGFGENPLFTCFVAEVENKIEGMALIYFRFSTWKGKNSSSGRSYCKRAYAWYRIRKCFV